MRVRLCCLPIVTVSVACADAPREPAWHQPQPTLSVSVAAAQAESVGLDTVRQLRVPAIEFVAVVMQDSEDDRFLLAEGAVNESDAPFAHTGDSAVVRTAHGAWPGVVHRVGAPGVPYRYHTQVTIRFPAPRDSVRVNAPVRITLRPIASSDFMPSVASSAVVRLPLGDAVFVPAGGGRFEVQWVWIGLTVGDRTLVREGLESGEVAAVRGLEALVRAARDSLASASPRGPR